MQLEEKDTFLRADVNNIYVNSIIDLLENLIPKDITKVEVILHEVSQLT